MMHPILGVGAIVVSEGQLLMVRRANDPGKGLWSVPGGRVEHGEYLVDAVRREVLEETGLEIEVGDLAGVFEVVSPDTHYVIHDYLAEAAGVPDPTPGSDVSEARWVPFGEIATLECTPRLAETLQAWGVLASG